MSLNVSQDAKYADGSWNWSVWIDGPDAELDQVESVEWVLHPTFTPPVVLVKERERKFRLDASGWGEFEINAHVAIKGGRKQHLKHWLRFQGSDEDESTESVPDQKPAVFISASVADADWENAVHEALTSRGFDVLTSSDVPSGVPAEMAISSTLDKASAVVGIFSDKSGPWTAREVNQAMEKDVSVIPFVVGDNPKITPELGSFEAVRVSHIDDVSAAIGQIMDKLA